MEQRRRRRQRWRRGEGAPCLHFAWNEGQDEGYVRDTEVEQCCVFLFEYVRACPPIDVYRLFSIYQYIYRYCTTESQM